jgi:DNA-binding CsgD family transcriptional regulator
VARRQEHTAGSDALIGRSAERQQLISVLDAARQGMSGVLVIHGEAGLGKSSLLDEAARLAADMDVVRLAGVQSEMQLGYAGLHQLLRADLARLDTLPVPHADAVRLAFGLQEGTRPDVFLLGLAALELLAARASERALVCIIDDVQWVDGETVDVLNFVARRLHADRIALLMAARVPGMSWRPPPDTPVLELTGLAESDAIQLLNQLTDGVIDPSVAAEIATHTRGNPLAFREIVRVLDTQQLTGRTSLPHPLPTGAQLEELFGSEAERLPSATRRFLLAAAADPMGSVATLWRAGRLLGFDQHDALSAQQAGMVSVDHDVHFRHPLIRSAVYYAATGAERRRVHAALADASEAESDIRLHAWHHAAGAEAPDEAIAAELEHVGDHAAKHGGTLEAGRFYQMAQASTPDLETQSRRALKAAEALTEAGSLGPAQAMLDISAAHGEDPRHRAVIGWVQGRISFLSGRPAEATSRLLAAARSMAVIDTRAARDIMVEAMVQAWTSGSLAPKGVTEDDVARAVLDVPLPNGEAPGTGDVLVDARLALLGADLVTAAPALRRATAVVEQDTTTGPRRLHWLSAGCICATMLDDWVALSSLSRHFESEARKQGNIGMLYMALFDRGIVELVSGNIRDAELSFLEQAAIGEARLHTTSLGRLLIAAWRGNAELTAELFTAVTAEAERHDQGYHLPFAEYARCVLALAEGREYNARENLCARLGLLSSIKFALPDAIEAAVRRGQLESAQSLLDKLEALAEASALPHSLGFLARGRALLAGADPAAESWYQEAIAQHRLVRGPAQLARSELVYGEWLRRQRRVRDARPHLRAAAETFRHMGALAFADRAEKELRVAGGEVTRPQTRQFTGLTVQEADVARLAASGMTNAEIGAQLFVSANTVDYHLRKVFRKLGITSRRTLSQHLDGASV